MEGEFQRTFKILFQLSMKKLLAKQPMGVRAQASVSPAAGPVPHASTSALGTAKISSKHMARRPVYEAINLSGKILLVVIMLLFFIIPLRYAIPMILQPEFLRLDYMRAPLAHGFWLMIIGFTIFALSPPAAVTNVQGSYIRSLIYPSQIKREYIEWYNIVMAEITVVGASILIATCGTYILWDVLVNPAEFLVFFFVGLVLGMNIVVNVFKLLPVVYKFAKSWVGYYGTFLFYFIFFLVCFYPMLLFMHKVATTEGLQTSWILINQDAIVRITFMVPDAILILISQDAPLTIKAGIILLLTGITVTSSGISYVLHTQVNSVTWKERYYFHRNSKKLEKQIKSTKKNKPPRGWDAVEVKGLDIFRRIPQKKISEGVVHNRDFYIAMAIFVTTVSVILLLNGASMFWLLYFLLAVPVFVIYPVLQNLGLILSKDGMKFFKLIPEPPRKISIYFTKSIEKYSLYAGVLLVAIIYLPLILTTSLGPFHIVIAAMAILHIVVFFAMILSVTVILDLKNAASTIKGHSLVKFFLPIYSSDKRESHMWFAIKDNLAIMGAVLLISLLVIIFLFLPFIVLLLFRLDNYIPLLLHVIMIAALFFFVRASLLDNLQAYLSFNKLRVNRIIKIIPLTIMGSYLFIEIVFIILTFL